MILEINKNQVLILRDLLMVEVDYLKTNAISGEEQIGNELSKKDVDELKKALYETEDLLSKVLELL